MRVMVPQRPTSLCETCSYALRVTDEHDRVVRSACNRNVGETMSVPLVVRACTAFNFRWDDGWEFKSRAWVLERKGTQIMGFRPPGSKKDP